MWWWFLTCDNTVQNEIFNRISMKLLMRQHGSYSTTCFWRTNLNEGTDLATLIPASFSLFSTGFAVLYRSSEASAGPLVLHLELECISCVAWIGLQGCLWQCKSKEQGSKSVWSQPKKCPAHASSWLWKGALKPHQAVHQSAWCRGEGEYSS